MAAVDDDYDLLIVGGGMVGASLAVALDATGLRIAIIEAVPFGQPGQPSYDERSIALAYGSRRILAAMGLWEALAGSVAAIRRIHVSDQGHWGAMRMDCRERRTDALGYVVANRDLGRVLFERLQSSSTIELIAPATMQQMSGTGAGMVVDVETAAGPRRLRTRLLVGADGGQSRVRELAGIAAERHDYGQTALIANVTTERAHEGRAFERFTAEGPLAMLPMTEGRCSLVWTRRSAHMADLLALDDDDFMMALEAAFGRRLGRIRRVGERAAYPLSLVFARSLTASRLALIGNAAHSLHPVAGQGFNLGLRDVATLAECIVQAHRSGADPGSDAVLADYARWRQRDQQRVVRMTDTLVGLFANEDPPLVLLRNSGLLALDMLPTLKYHFMEQMMGVAGRQPSLACGLPL